jgi:hypothetical protein
MAQADPIANPLSRKLRGFAFDPSGSGQVHTSRTGDHDQHSVASRPQAGSGRPTQSRAAGQRRFFG